MKSKLIPLFIAGLILAGCNTTQKPKENAKTKAATYNVPAGEHMMQAILWQQLAAEHRALCYQAFNIAKSRLNIALAKKSHWKKPLAIVTDIDESILNNSPYDAKLALENKEYSQRSWSHWVRLEKATAVPGAVQFMQYAKKKGVQVFYISNRRETLLKPTMENLRKLGFPYIDKEHFLLRTKSSSKHVRRETVRKSFHVVMYIGDNMSDLNHLFDYQGTQRRNAITDSLKNEFGDKYIVLPNPVYGDWETHGIYESNYHWTEAQKDSIRRTKLITY